MDGLAPRLAENAVIAGQQGPHRDPLAGKRSRQRPGHVGQPAGLNQRDDL